MRRLLFTLATSQLLRLLPGTEAAWFGGSSASQEDLSHLVSPIINRELARFIAEGPTEEELARVQTRINASTVRGLELDGKVGHRRHNGVEALDMPPLRCQLRGALDHQHPAVAGLATFQRGDARVELVAEHPDRRSLVAHPLCGPRGNSARSW